MEIRFGLEIDTFLRKAGVLESFNLSRFFLLCKKKEPV